MSLFMKVVLVELFLPRTHCNKLATNMHSHLNTKDRPVRLILFFSILDDLTI